jgi:hypothetical protein
MRDGKLVFATPSRLIYAACPLCVFEMPCPFGFLHYFSWQDPISKNQEGSKYQ